MRRVPRPPTAQLERPADGGPGTGVVAPLGRQRPLARPPPRWLPLAPPPPRAGLPRRPPDRLPSPATAVVSRPCESPRTLQARRSAGGGADPAGRAAGGAAGAGGPAGSSRVLGGPGGGPSLWLQLARWRRWGWRRSCCWALTGPRWRPPAT